MAPETGPTEESLADKLDQRSYATPVDNAGLPAVAPPVGSETNIQSEPQVDAKAPVSRATPRALTSAAKVKAVAARMPDATATQIAAKVGVSESTVRRHLASPSGEPPAETPAFG